jgi:anti-sigma factor RsiW
MSCTEARQHWMLYLDSEGDRELRLAIRDHIGECPACARWFAEQRRLEQEIARCLCDGSSTAALWSRVLSKAGVQPPSGRQPRRWRILAAIGMAAAVLLALFVRWHLSGRSPSAELTRNAAELHQQWLRGEVRPDFISTAEGEVDRYFKTSVPFKVHCPPRTDVNFQVKGAGVIQIRGRHQAAYIVGHVGKAPVSIVVLDRAGVEGIPHGGFQNRQEGEFQVMSGVVAENVVVVIGSTSPDVLKRVLTSYGSYHDG